MEQTEYHHRDFGLERRVPSCGAPRTVPLAMHPIALELGPLLRPTDADESIALFGAGARGLKQRPH